MELTPADLQEQWGPPLRKVEFDPTPVLPDETTAFFKFAGLPQAATVGCSGFRFVTTSHRLADVWQQELDPRVSMPSDWNRFWHLGEVEYDQSAAWLCIEEKTGKIISIDAEIDDSLTQINSSILLFMTCLKVIRDWSQETGGSMEEFEGLMESLESDIQDNDAEEYWLPFLEYAQEESDDSFEVSVT
jgi:hypothetical protein